MDYLYALQNLREAAPSFINSMFVAISEYVLMLGPVIVMLIYWCVNKRTGEWMMLSLGVSITLTDFIKILACIPRPWLFDGRLHLADAAADSATGFSFPSGHTTYATSTFGNAAVYASNGPAKAQVKGERGLGVDLDGNPLPAKNLAKAQAARTLAGIGTVKRRRIWLSVVLVALVILVAFSRNWLGAHTFADVSVAILVSAAVAFGMYWLLKLVAKNPKADIWVAAGLLAFIVIVGLIAQFAPAPVVTDGAGNVLDLDHYVLRTDLFGSMGILAATVVGWIVERRFIGFTDAATTKERIIRFVFGMVVFGLSYFVLGGLLTSWIPGAHLAKFCKRFVSFIFPTLLVPAGIKWYQNRLAKKAAEAAPAE